MLKNTAYCLLFIFLSLVTLSCAYSNVSNSEDVSLSKLILGTWVDDDGIVSGEMSFFPDGNCTVRIDIKSEEDESSCECTWSIENARLTMIAGECNGTLKLEKGHTTVDTVVSITNKTMVLIDENGNRLIRDKAKQGFEI